MADRKESLQRSHVRFPSDPNLLETKYDGSNDYDDNSQFGTDVTTPTGVDDTETSADVTNAADDRGVGLLSIIIMLCINFLANIVFSIVIPSVWPFLVSLGTPSVHIHKSMVGWAVAANSAGTFISAPLLGAWADRWNTRGVMLITLILMILGNFCYSMAYRTFGDNVYINVGMLLGGRFVVGFAAGNYAVVQSYFSYATKPSQRLAVMSWNAGTTVIGFIIGPAIAAAVSTKHNYHVGPFWFNDKTLPGYLSAVAAFVAMAALLCLEDVERPSASQARAQAETIARQQAENVSQKYGDQQPLLGNAPSKSMTVNRASSVANYGSWMFGGGGFYDQPVAPQREPESNVEEFAANDDRARTWAGGFLKHASVPSYGSHFGRSASDPIDLATGQVPWVAVILCLVLNFMFTLTFTCIETIGPPYTGANPGLKWGVEQNGLFFMGMGVLCILSLIALQFINKLLNDRVILIGASFFMAVGFGFNWPVHGTQPDGKPYWPPVYAFMTGCVLTSLGYSSGCAVLLAIYSKVLEGLDQGAFMGWFSAACSMARIIGPLAASYIINYDATARWLWGGVAILLFLSGIVALVGYAQLQPQCEKDQEGTVIN
mmetsp:Transcript_19559/g.33619  ORF Transcript_19559/g.33619 Transcript_19559/m.33619 type:complete len:603 (-) Transcript_19559:63-1871(-)